MSTWNKAIKAAAEVVAKNLKSNPQMVRAIRALKRRKKAK